ncbi:MAG: UDP-glucose 4-epimerase GalE [Bacteroidetes bacterium]|nr:MAG: UDP-glucose 4-epimerase GalE [Bacteroidota bacterium]
MPTILITGGCGYIGSHTAIELLNENRFDVISIDNLSHSTERTLERIEAITGKRMLNYAIDLRELEATRMVFEAHNDIVGVIHFAALKSVAESVNVPLTYYDNNLGGLINILRCCAEYGVANFIFSSSCSIYGNISQLPVKEDSPVNKVESPYANTKLIGEQIMQDFCRAGKAVSCVSLRYFNPVGAHTSGLNGEVPSNRPNNLVPMITQAAAGLIPRLTVYGGDYPTRDGTCIRDYVHVTDIAIAHIKALDYLMHASQKNLYEVFNLGSGKGVSVLEAIEAFQRVTGQQLPYHIGPRRAGDVQAIYSDCSKARKQLGWTATRSIDDMMASAWKWQQTLLHEQQQLFIEG